jgi:hypothetical protein
MKPIQRVLGAAAAALLFASCVSSPCPEDIALVDRANRELLLKGKGTPAEFAADKMGSHPTFIYRRMLLGELKPGIYGTRESARAIMNDMLAEIDLGFAWPIKTPPQFDLPHTATKPVIDADLDEDAWRNALTFTGEYPLNSLEKRDSGIVWKLMWDEDCLYVGAIIPDATITSIDFDEANRKYPWDADVLEIFVMPDRRFKSYWEVVVNPDNSIVDGLHTYNVVARTNNGLDESMQGLATQTRRAQDGYTVEAALPFIEMPNYRLGNPPKAGESVHLVLVRIDDGQRSAFVPFLYDGHNLFGYPQFILRK